MNNYVYEITNNINGKKYIGKRSCKCSIEKDTYMGSGVLIKKAIEKYGVENFTKRIIKTFDTEEESFEFERKIINELNACERKEFYNIHEGGNGGNTRKGMSELQKRAYSKKLSEALSGDKNPNYGKVGRLSPNYGRKCSEETKRKIGEKHKGKTVSEETRMKLRQHFIGTKLSKDTRSKISKSLIGKMAKEKNPMYGKRGELCPSYGRRRTKQEKQKMSENRKGLCTGKDNPASRKVRVILHNGQEIVFDTVKDAYSYFGVNKGTFHLWLKNGTEKSRKFKTVIKNINYT